MAATQSPGSDSWAELAAELRGREQWLVAADHRRSKTTAGQQLDQIEAVLRQRRLREAVRVLARSSSKDLLQEERLQELGKLFCACAHETVSYEDTEVVLQTLAALDNLGGSGDVLHQLVMVLLAVLPEKESAEGLTSQIIEWKRRCSATEGARKFCGFVAATCADASAATPEERAAALEHLRKSEKLSETDPIPRALGKAAAEHVARLRTWLALTCKATLHSCQGALEGALSSFREASGGRLDGGHWKAALTESSKWDDVLREATYHLLTPNTSGKAYSERVAALSTELAAGITTLQEALSASAACAGVGAAVAGLTALEEECKALVASSETAIMSAHVVDTEGFFCQVLSIARTDEATGKLRHRIAQMAKKAMKCSAIHPLIWAKVMSTVEA